MSWFILLKITLAMIWRIESDDGHELKWVSQVKSHHSGPRMNDGGLGQDGRRRNWEKWTVPEYILEAELKEPADRSDVGQEEKIGIRMTLRFLAWATGWMVVPLSGMENGRQRNRFTLREGEYIPFVFNMLSLKQPVDSKWLHQIGQSDPWGGARGK